MTDTTRLTVAFDGVSAARAGELARELQEALLDTAPGVKTELTRADPQAMDLGATLVLLLGTPALVALAKGVADFIAREREVLIVRDDRGEIVYKGHDAAAVAAALRQAAAPKAP